MTGGSAVWQNLASVTVSASGSTDTPGSGIAGYSYRTSTNAGATWSAVTNAGSVAISAQLQTLVQFRARDNASNVSGWVQTSVWLDRTAPTDPTVAGGSAVWQSVASVMVSASGSTDTLSGLLGYEYQTSTDNGATWSASTSGAATTISAEGQTLVRFRSIDNVALTSAWVQATVRLDRTVPTDPTVSGGSAVWQNLVSVTVSASGSTDAPGHCRLLLPHLHQRRRDVVGRHQRRLGRDLGPGPDPGPVPRPRQCHQRLRLGADVGLARPHRAHEPDRDRRLGGLAERCLGVRDRVRLDGRALRPRRLRVPDLDRQRRHLVGLDQRGRHHHLG